MESDNGLRLSLDSPGQYKIIQIIPANGFNAVFAHEDENGELMELERIPLVCWGLMDVVGETPDRSASFIFQDIRGFIADNDGFLSPVTADDKGFLSYEAPGIGEDDRFIEIYEESKG